MDSQVRKTHCIPSRINKKKSIVRHIIVKLKNTEIFKPGVEKGWITHKKDRYHDSRIIKETMKATKKWNNFFEV